MRTTPAARPLGDDAIGTFREIFRADPLSLYPSEPARLSKGTAPQGWEYFMIRKLVGGQEGDGRGFGAILVEAKVGDQTATIFATSKDFIVSNCFGELLGDQWPAFFSSLRFKNGPATGVAEAEIRRQMAGTWTTGTASVGLGYVFTANGRYASAATRHSPLLGTTDAYFGDGSYSFDGNTLVLTGDDRRRTTQSFRLHQESRDNGRTWADRLCLMDPGASGEVCYRKQ